VIIRTRDRPVSFFETDTDIFKQNFTDIWSAADIVLTTDTDFQNLLTDVFADILTKHFG